MTSFAEWFGEGQTLRLQTTFRSPQSICDVASEFVAKNPRQLTKVVTSAHPGYGQAASLVRVRRFDEVSEPARVLDDLAARVRTGEVTPGAPGWSRSTCSVATGSTATHSPDGRPPSSRSRSGRSTAPRGSKPTTSSSPTSPPAQYGFPSEVADDPVMSLAMAETDPYPFAEERRLFYVALTERGGTSP